MSGWLDCLLDVHHTLLSLSLLLFFRHYGVVAMHNVEIFMLCEAFHTRVAAPTTRLTLSIDIKKEIVAHTLLV